MGNRGDYSQSVWRREFGGMPLWGIVTCIVFVLGIVGAASEWSANQAPAKLYVPRAGAPETSTSTPTPTPTPSPTPSISVAFIGDSYTSGSVQGAGTDHEWPALVAARVSGIATQTHAHPGAGYVRGRVGGTTFADAVSEITGKPDVVLVFGSGNDLAGYQPVHAAALALYAQIHTINPPAKIIVVGPPWLTARPPTAILRSRDALRDAAAQSGAVFVDPIADRWFVNQPSLIGADGVHPNDAGNAYLADKISAILTANLPH